MPRISKKNFELCARAIILKRNKILLCWNKKGKHFFFPGGHIYFGERAEFALRREIKEEIGVLIKKSDFIGAVENVFWEENVKHHELNLVFYTELKKTKLQVRENHIGFDWKSLEEFKEERVLPLALQKSLLRWFKDKKIFWSSQIS